MPPSGTPVYGTATCGAPTPISPWNKVFGGLTHSAAAASNWPRPYPHAFEEIQNAQQVLTAGTCRGPADGAGRRHNLIVDADKTSAEIIYRHQNERYIVAISPDEGHSPGEWSADQSSTVS